MCSSDLDVHYKQVSTYLKLSNKKLGILVNFKELKEELNRTFLKEWFEVLTFENLAIEQLNLKEKISKETWEKYYLGEEGNASFYYDAVSKKAFRSSTELLEKELIGNNAMFIFNELKKERW